MKVQENGQLVDTGRTFEEVIETICKQLCKVLNVPENQWKQFSPDVRTKMIDNSINTLLYVESRRLLVEVQQKKDAEKIKESVQNSSQMSVPTAEEKSNLQKFLTEQK